MIRKLKDYRLIEKQFNDKLTFGKRRNFDFVS